MVVDGDWPFSQASGKTEETLDSLGKTGGILYRLPTNGEYPVR